MKLDTITSGRDVELTSTEAVDWRGQGEEATKMKSFKKIDGHCKEWRDGVADGKYRIMRGYL